jgi:hypothetical protein
VPVSGQRYRFKIFINGNFHSWVDCLPCGRNWIKRRRKRLAVEYSSWFGGQVSFGRVKKST